MAELRADFDILFPDNREEGENTLRQSQLVMLRMLKIFDYLCVKHNIKYFLIGGTLIGAIRHKGFIPWDDDLDVAMTRDQYDKFLQYAVPELPSDIFFQNPQTDRFYLPNCNVDARLRDKYSSYTHIDKENNKWHEGLQVDIFVHDRSYLPHNFFVIALNKITRSFNNNTKRASLLKWIARYSPFPLVYSSNYLQYFSVMKLGTYIKEKELYPLLRTCFEDAEVFIPRDYDSYLKRQFGDYMKLPPEEKRVSDHKVLADPFKPCDHTEILHWNQRKNSKSSLQQRNH